MTPDLFDNLLRDDPFAVMLIVAATLGALALLMEWGISAWQGRRERKMRERYER